MPENLTEDHLRSARMVPYEGVSKRFRTGRLEREPQMVKLSATRCSYIAALWASLVSFPAINLCVTSQRVFIIAVIYFVVTQSGKFWIHCRIWLQSFLPNSFVINTSFLFGLHKIGSLERASLNETRINNCQWLVSLTSDVTYEYAPYFIFVIVPLNIDCITRTICNLHVASWPLWTCYIYLIIN